MGGLFQTLRPRSEIEATAIHSPFVEMLRGLARGDVNELSHLLIPHEVPVQLEGTRSSVRTHFLAVNANDEPAVDLLGEAMARAAVDFCIPRSRVVEAIRHFEETRSTSHFSRLEQQARELFVDSDTSGEGGELLLFLLMEQVLQLPQLLSKMSLKTNSNVHVHGTDGVHAKLTDEGILDLYWGESKLYTSSSKAFDDCFDSIAPFLTGNDEARRRDILLIRENLNVQEEELASYLLQYFDETSPHALQLRWNGACLIGFDYPTYPNLKALQDEQISTIASSVARWHRAISKRLNKHALLDINIEIFCLPFPDVHELRQMVRRKLGVV